MARRRIGQEAFGFVQGERARNARLDALGSAIEWAPVEKLLDGIHAAAKGELAWPPLALFKALLLGLWHDLSDVALAEALEDRASFRRFCGFSSSEAVPERTAFVRFRRELVTRQFDEGLLRAVVRQLEAQGLVVRTGTLVDATVIRVAAKTDGEAEWCVYAGPRRTPVKGYKAHVAADEAGGIVRRVEVTPANVHDSRGFEPVLPARPGRVWADRAYDSHAPRRGAGAARGSADRKGGDGAHGAGQGRGAAGVEPDGGLGALPGGEDLRHGQAQLRSRPGALPRARASVAAGAPDLPRLQPDASGAPPGRTRGYLTEARAAPRPAETDRAKSSGQLHLPQRRQNVRQGTLAPQKPAAHRPLTSRFLSSGGRSRSARRRRACA